MPHLSRAVPGLAVVLAFLPVRSACAQGAAAPLAHLGFEGSTSGRVPAGWGGGPPATLHADDEVVHGGAWSCRLERDGKSPGEFSTITQAIPLDRAGRSIELRGFVRSEGVTSMAGLWMREDAESGFVQFDNMRDRPIVGTTAWTEYRIQLPLDAKAVSLAFGALLAGEGKVWIDDLQLLVDGTPFADAPRRERPPTALDRDHEFDAGSGVSVETLSAVQLASLTTLGKTWGFLKHHHPKVVSGGVHWDYALFRVLPRVLAAGDAAAANAAILEWATSLGPVADCSACAQLPADLALRPDLEWIHDRSRLGEELASFLERVHRNRPVVTEQAYVGFAPFVGNPDFRLETTAADGSLPDAGERILALFRWWNAVQSWSPYRDVIGEDWNAVLPEQLPSFVAAKDEQRYQLAMLAAIARLNDGHANLWRSLAWRPPTGPAMLPVRLRFVEGRPVVAGWLHAEKGPASGLKIGDALVTLDGRSVESLFQEWKPWYAASNDAARMRAMMDAMTRGAAGAAKVVVDRAGTKAELSADRIAISELQEARGFPHDLAGPAFRRLSPEVAYLKLSAVAIADIPGYLKEAEGSKGWILDIRNYPSEFVVFALGGHFVPEPTAFARFTVPDASNPGAFTWTPPVSLEPVAPRYPGKVVILVDEVSMSQAEYTAMAFRSSPSAVVVGSTTSGADGNVSSLPLPGGLSTMISGIGVFYPDKRPTQRVGIVPDVEARPTIAGLGEGRDEVLEAAVREILGKDAEESKVRAIARP